MKSISIAIFFIFWLVCDLWAAGSCVQTSNRQSTGFFTIKLACTGDSANGSIPLTAISTTNMSVVKDMYYLYTVSAYPTAGGTAPDAADVFILDANGEDLLGSADGGTTAKNGANLIHATLKNTAFPYSSYLNSNYFPPVTSNLTLKVLNQSTNSATYTIELIFVR